MKLISQYSALLKEEINKLNLPKHPINLYDPIRYFLDMEGKKIRPILTLLSAELFGGKFEHSKYAALAIEIFHNFTLIHDDIMDKAPIRRGKQTIHEKWDTNIAILSGDVLLVKAYEQLALCPSSTMPELLKIFNKTAKEVCEGQQMDMDFENHEHITQEEYIQMIRLKTSVLLGCALEMGAIVSEESAMNRSEIYQFGVHVGIAFQIQDDLLDLYGNMEKVGKQTGGDIIANKNTLLSILAESHASESQLHELKKLKSETDLNVKVIQTKLIFDSLDVKAKCHEIMQSYYQLALANFSSIQVENKNDALIDLTGALMNRDF